MLKVTDLHKEIGGKILLAEASFYVGNSDKVAIVGPNGVGKSTLLKIIAGKMEPDGGQIEFQGDNICIGYLMQDTQELEALTVESFIKRETGIQALEERMQSLEADLENIEILKEYGELQSLFARMDGYAFQHNMEKTLRGLGLSEIDIHRKIVTLSGGQKSKVQLAAILLKGIDLLLLDEPTNNLDLEALIWLEKYLKKTPATCLIVSHDKVFLDNVVSKVFEINWTDGQIIKHNTGYTEYLQFKEKETLRLKEQYAQQKEKIEELTEEMNKKKTSASKVGGGRIRDNDKFARNFKNERQSVQSGKQAKRLEKQIEQMEKIELPKEKPPLVINIKPDDSLSKQSIVLSNITASYDSGFKLGPLSLQILFSERVCFFGPNGSGKSTLMRIITGEQKPDGGNVSLGNSLILGSLMQDHRDLPKEKKVYDYLKRDVGIKEEADIFYKLVHFGFDKDDANKQIGQLSPGGRVRLLLANFSYRCVNTLVLDEPTNHLDVEAVEELERALQSYPGTVVLVSHDRDFIRHVKPAVNYYIENGHVKEIPDYESYFTEVGVKMSRLV